MWNWWSVMLFLAFFFSSCDLKEFLHVKLLPPVSGYITIKFVLIRLKMCCVNVLNLNIIILSCTTMVGLAMSLKQVLHIWTSTIMLFWRNVFFFFIYEKVWYLEKKTILLWQSINFKFYHVANDITHDC